MPAARKKKPALIIPSFRFQDPRQLRGYAETCDPTEAYAEAIAADHPTGGPAIPRRLPADLTPIEHRQCVDALTAGQASDLTLPELLTQLDTAFEGMEDIRLAALRPPIEWWNLVDASGQLHFRAWFYGVDSGVIYAPESLERSGSYCQCTLDIFSLLSERPGGALLWLALLDAQGKRTKFGNRHKLGVVEDAEG